MPDLNQNNPLVLNYLIQNTIWWMEYANIDGLRVDTYSFNDKMSISQWTKAIMDEYPNTNITGEVWMHDQAQISYWQKDSPIGSIASYNSHLPSVMDFTLQDAFQLGIKESEIHWNKGMIRFYENFVNDFLYKNPNQLLVFMENHDTPRFNEYCPDIRDYKLAFTMLATLRGIPQIYYGSEIGMKGSKDKGDADIRRDFPGGWSSDMKNAFTAKGRNKIQNEYFDFTKKILNWRKNKSVIHFGKFLHFIPKNNVYVYLRYNDIASEKVLVIINNSIDKQNVEVEPLKKYLAGKNVGNEIISEKQISLGDDIKIDGKSSMIIEID